MRRTSVIVAAGLAALAGLAACGGEEPGVVTAELPDEGDGVTLDLPPMEPPTNSAAAVPEPGPAEANAAAPAPEPEQPKAPPAAQQREEVPEPEPEPEPKQAPEPAEKTAPAAEPAPAAAAAGDAAGMVLLEPRPAETVAAWAGHIRRAGFDCGGVGSARQLQRPNGETLQIYRIDCTSGGAYQGTVKRGRLYFRRWTGRLNRR